MISTLDSLIRFVDNVEFGSIALLLIKLTLLLAAILLIQQISPRQSATFRHGVLAVVLIATPILFAFHFLAPSWSIPGTS